MINDCFYECTSFRRCVYIFVIANKYVHYFIKEIDCKTIKMKKGYIRGSSDNVPKIDLDMLLEYVTSNESSFSAEMRGVKALSLVGHCINV